MRLGQLLLASGLASTAFAACPDYGEYAQQKHPPFSGGKYNLSYQRPEESCRKFILPEAETAIKEMKEIVKDQDLFRLFENAFPNTLDTTISWRGFAADNEDEEVGPHAYCLSIHVRLTMGSLPSSRLETS